MLILLLWQGSLHHSASGAPAQHIITLDGASLQILLPFQTAGFIASGNDEWVQTATALTLDPYLEVSMTAIPLEDDAAILREFGSLPAKVGAEISALQALRAMQNATPAKPISINFFGEPITGIANIVNLNLASTIPEPVIIHEWVARQAQRIWLLRISQRANARQVSAETLGALEIIPIDLNQPSISMASTLPKSAMPTTSITTVGDLPLPSWWQGDCDVLNFPGSYPLGGSYRGVKACGPIGTEHAVYFGVGYWQLEWQCPELPKRYLYIGFGTPPYRAHGKDVVWNYPGTDFEKVPNGTPGKGPSTGDVLSYGAATAYGHTSLVSAANINANGNGSITIVEQNWSSTGTRTHSVINWTVQSSMAVSGWLHGLTSIEYIIYMPLIRR